MSQSLEARYRRLLGWYPRVWRAKNEDAVLGTLLDVADSEGRTDPTRRERASIASHGVSARLDRVIVPAVRDAGSTIALSLGAGVALTEFVMSSWAPWGAHAGASGWWPETNGPFYDTGFLFAGFWLIALMAAAAGHWMLGRVSLLGVLTATVVTPYLFTTYPGITSVDPATITLLAACALVAVIGTPHRGLALVGATAGWALIALMIYLVSPEPSEGWQSSRTLWDQVGAIWYAAATLLAVAIAFAVARCWIVTFSLILGLAPLALTFVVNDLRHDLIESGSAAVVAIPVGMGLVLLMLFSSGRLTLPSRRRGRRITFESTLAVILLAGALTATAVTSSHGDTPASHLASSGTNTLQAFAPLTPPRASSPVTASQESVASLISSGRLTSIDLDPVSGKVISFSGHDLGGDPSSQQALDDAVTAPLAKRELFDYVSAHATTATIDAQTGKLTRVIFTG